LLKEPCRIVSAISGREYWIARIFLQGKSFSGKEDDSAGYGFSVFAFIIDTISDELIGTDHS
jgi:hypothetical protein